MIEKVNDEDVMEIQVEVLQNMFNDEIKKLMDLKNIISAAMERDLGITVKITFVEQMTMQQTTEGIIKLVIDKR